MRLNLDCVRDILLCVEENSNLYTPCVFIEFGSPALAEFRSNDDAVPPYQLALNSKYGNEELIYHVKYCSTANFITEVRYLDNDMLCIDDLTPQGHEFLANVRNDSVWNKTKAAAVKLGVSSIPALLDIASKIVTTLITTWSP